MHEVAPSAVSIAVAIDAIICVQDAVSKKNYKFSLFCCIIENLFVSLRRYNPRIIKLN